MRIGFIVVLLALLTCACTVRPDVRYRIERADGPPVEVVAHYVRTLAGGCVEAYKINTWSAVQPVAIVCGRVHTVVVVNPKE